MGLLASQKLAREHANWKPCILRRTCTLHEPHSRAPFLIPHGYLCMGWLAEILQRAFSKVLHGVHSVMGAIEGSHW